MPPTGAGVDGAGATDGWEPVRVWVAQELRLFLRARDRGGVVDVPHRGHDTVGHVVQSLGVPLTEVGALEVGALEVGALEVGALEVGGRRVEPAYRPGPEDELVVHPVTRPQPLAGAPRFLLDAHLGALARRLRVLGVDAAYDRDADDDALVRRAGAEDRVLLTQDRGLLRRRALRRAAYVRGSQPDDQVRDVLDRFAPPLRPFTRCTACGGVLDRVAKEAVADELLPGTRRSYDAYARCRDCRRVYWRGAHAARLDRLVASATEDRDRDGDRDGDRGGRVTRTDNPAVASHPVAPDTAPADARRMWTLFETVHAVTYFTPHVPEAFARVGVPGFWRSYFAARAAPLGAIGPAPVTALFLSFAPSMVARALPDVWTRISPEEATRTRLRATTQALHEVLGDVPRDVLDDVVASLEVAVAALDCSGRALAAAHLALPWPDDPLARLWWATTLLREHRGDGHVAALVTAGVSGLQAQVWRAAGDGSRAELQGYRGWTDEEWSAAQDALAARGWLDAAGALTPAGRAAHRAVEDTTDALAAPPWRALGPDRTERLARQLQPLAETASRSLRYPNPIGVERPQPG